MQKAQMHRVLLLACLLLVLGGGPLVWGQHVEAPSDAVQVAFDEGVEAMKRGDGPQATRLLHRVVEQAPAYWDSEEGAAAYWLGKAYAADDQIDQAIETWRMGLLALHESGRFEARLADAFVRTVFEEEDEANYPLAADAYLRMLQRLDESPRPEERPVLADHLAALEFVLPDEIEAQAGLTDVGIHNEDAPIAHVHGESLVEWWRSQDPLPATLQNERLFEHLERVTYAEQNYAYSDAPTGVDDRGEVYIRYGEPRHRETINFNETRLTDEITRPGISVNLSDFPENEFWSYGDIDRSGYYLFVKEDGAYHEATFEKLFPRPLRSGFSSSDRGQRRAYLMLATARAIYRKLSPYHPDLALRHDEVANYMAAVEDVGLTSRGDLNEQRSVNTQERRPHDFAQKNMLENRNRDNEAMRRRTKFMPPQATRIFQETEQLDVAVRTARFLDDNGTTRTEVYWSPTPEALELSDERRDEFEEDGHTEFDEYVIRLTAAQQLSDYQDRIINQKHYRITSLPGEEATIPAQTFSVQGDTALYHLALQWDQYLVDTDEGDLQKGPRVKLAAHQEDSLQALTADDRTLEMSDVRAMTLPPETPEHAIEEALPYPFRQITPDQTLILYFEIYHLTFGNEDQTRYTIEYEVERRDERGQIARLFRGDKTQRTTAATEQEGDRRNTQEYITLQLDEWDGRGALEVTVRVTDEVSGQQKERSLELEAVQ